MRWTNLFALFFLAACATPQEQSSPQSDKTEKVNRKKIAGTIASHRKYLSQCYGKILTKKGNENLKGKVLVHFKIGPDGKAFAPRMVKEKSSLQNSELNQCLFAGLTSWDFPVHPDGEEIEVRYPFGFSDTPPPDMQKKLDQFKKLRTQ